MAIEHRRVERPLLTTEVGSQLDAVSAVVARELRIRAKRVAFGWADANPAIIAAVITCAAWKASGLAHQLQRAPLRQGIRRVTRTS